MDNDGMGDRGAGYKVAISNVFAAFILPLIIPILRYNWKKFAVVTSAIAGHDDFVQVWVFFYLQEWYPRKDERYELFDFE